jgi:hypothetical protein
MIEYSYYLVLLKDEMEIFDDISREELDSLIKNNKNSIRAVHKIVKGSDTKRNIYLYEAWMYDEFNYIPDGLITHNRNLDPVRYGQNTMTTYDCELVKMLYNIHKNK